MYKYVGRMELCLLFRTHVLHSWLWLPVR